ncbi:MAG: hypothetical protein ABR878_14250 [Roseiarcus sp.]|jgi:hypothetical protein
MQKLPPKPFELSRNGIAEDDVQLVYDALTQAEDDRIRFVNAYFFEAVPGFLFTNDRAEADQELRIAATTKKPAVGFEDTGETWEVRPVM